MLDSLINEKAALRQGYEQVERTAETVLNLDIDAELNSRDLFEDDFEHESKAGGDVDEAAQAKSTRSERIQRMRHRRTKTRTTATQGQHVVHFDAAQEVATSPREEVSSPQKSEAKTEAAPATPASNAKSPNGSGAVRRRSSIRSDRTGPLTDNHVLDFIYRASTTLDSLDRLIDNLSQKYTSVLAYFGEDPKMPSHDFFNTLNAFALVRLTNASLDVVAHDSVQAFSEAHEQVERIEKTRERQQKQAEALEKRTLSRRASQPAMKLSDAVGC